jgi:hypothetical protein
MAQEAPAPVLRLKRRRDEAGIDTLLLEADERLLPAAKRVATANEVAAMLGAMGVAESPSAAETTAQASLAADAPASKALVKYRFRRVISTSESSLSQSRAKELLASLGRLRQPLDLAARQQDKAAERLRGTRAQAYSSIRTAERQSASTAGHSNTDDTDSVASSSHPLGELFRIVDVLGPAARSSAESSTGAADALDDGEDVELVRRLPVSRDPAAVAARCSFVPILRPVPRKVLNPMELRMDKALWTAWKMGDFRPVFEALAFGCNVNYQRVSSDLSTALMVAAHHGNSKVAASLVRQGALVRIPDFSGRTAVQFAADASHIHLANRLRSVLQDELDEIDNWTSGSSLHEGGKYEYDLFVLEQVPEETASAMPDSAAASVSSSEQQKAEPATTRVLKVAPQSWELLHTMTGSSSREDDEDDQWVFVDRQGDDSPFDSEDSNAEDAEGNEYPDEESDDGSSVSEPRPNFISRRGPRGGAADRTDGDAGGSEDDEDADADVGYSRQRFQRDDGDDE